jgi:membrane protease YdiL (CAAX protease family)
VKKTPDSGSQESSSARTSFPHSSWGPRAAIAGLLTVIGVQIVVASCVGLTQGNDRGEWSTEAALFLRMSFEATLIAVAMVIASAGGIRWRAALQRLGLHRFSLSALGYVAASIVAYFFFITLYVSLIDVPDQESFQEAHGSVPWPIEAFSLVIAAPISEEIFFRGVLFAGLRRQEPLMAAALISAAIFGVMHAGTGISAVPVIIVIGVMLAVLYEKTGSLIPCILFHAILNSLNLLA